MTTNPDDWPTQEPDRVWSTVPDSPRSAFGSSIKGRHANTIATLPLITERPRRFSDPALRGPPCPVCGADGEFYCGCEEEV